MNKIITILLLTITTTVSAQVGKMFKGTINKSLKITLYLQGINQGTNADPILGIYKCDHQKDFILLNGYRNDKGNVVLVEQSSANFSGVFLGTLRNKLFKGEWSAADLKVRHPFTLTEISVTPEERSRFQKAIEDKGAEFRAY